MRKIVCVFLLTLLPLMAFSESVFMFHIGTDIQKGCHINALDNLVKGLLVKHFGGDPASIQSPRSKILIPMLSVGLDMQFISQKNGFTFFWNHAFLYADHATGYSSVDITYDGDKLNSKLEEGKDIFKKKFHVYSTEMLFGGTFRRENAFNIHFGVGFKTQFTPGMIWDIIGIVTGSYPSSVKMYAMLAGFGGTVGFTYYFNNVVGLTFSINEFVGLGGMIVADVNGMETKSLPDGGRAMLTLGVNNNFAMKFGLSLRIHGSRGDTL